MATHNYTWQIQGEHYVFEAAKDFEAAQELKAADFKDVQSAQPIDRFIMTAYSYRRVKVGDTILLRQCGKSVRYQVEQIDYYCDQSDLWIAQLIKLDLKIKLSNWRIKLG